MLSSLFFHFLHVTNYFCKFSCIIIQWSCLRSDHVDPSYLVSSASTAADVALLGVALSDDSSSLVFGQFNSNSPNLTIRTDNLRVPEAGNTRSSGRCLTCWTCARSYGGTCLLLRTTRRVCRRSSAPSSALVRLQLRRAWRIGASAPRVGRRRRGQRQHWRRHVRRR